MSDTRPSTARRVRFGRAGISAAVLLAVALLSPHASAEPVEGLPFVTDVRIVGDAACDTCPPRVCADRPMIVTVSGGLPNSCVSFRGLTQRPVRSLAKVIVADFVVEDCGVPCLDIARLFSATIELPPGEIGPNVLWVESVVRSCPDTTVVARTGSRPFDYEVLGSCNAPVDSLLRSFLAFSTQPAFPCAGDDVALLMRKAGCPPCLRFESFGMDSTTGLSATMDWRVGCLEFACIPETLGVRLGQLAAGHFLVGVNVKVNVLGTDVPDSSVSFRVDVPFDVAQTCDTTGCVLPALFTEDGNSRCAVNLAPGGEGGFTLYAHSPVPLGGLQGSLRVEHSFRVTGVFPPAGFPGIHVSWVPEGRGARYVLFTTGGGAIPAGQSPVLTVTVAADTGLAPGSEASMSAMLSLASDPAGRGVWICSMENIRLAPIRLCVGDQAGACDANHDLHSDVRDLVLMSACLRIDPPPGGTELCQDCDGDGHWAFADLVCCAQRILQLPIVPRDSVSDGPELSIEEVSRGPYGRMLRIRLAGANALDAAMLRLRYPGERWRADYPIAIEGRAPDPTGWWPLVDPEVPGVLRLGALKLSTTAAPELDFYIHMTALAEAHERDEIVAEGADLSGSDGVAFTVAALPKLSLTGAPPPPPPAVSRIELGPARPNPFTSSTSFTVSLPAAAHVELTVHDLFGRRVATLLAGELPAGQRAATWNASGARDGMYFARLVVNGKVFTQRVALLRDRR